MYNIALCKVQNTCYFFHDYRSPVTKERLLGVWGSIKLFIFYFDVMYLEVMHHRVNCIEGLSPFISCCIDSNNRKQIERKVMYFKAIQVHFFKLLLQWGKSHNWSNWRESDVLVWASGFVWRACLDVCSTVREIGLLYWHKAASGLFSVCCLFEPESLD